MDARTRGVSASVNVTLPTADRWRHMKQKRHTPCPYTDQFPFAACGVPGIWLYRPNCNSGQYYHHRFDNTPAIIDFRQSAVALSASMEIMRFLANVDDATHYRYIPSEMQQEIDTLFGAVYGGF